MSAVVTVTINGRSFRMACDAGQENHLLELASQVDEKINLFKGSYGEIGDNRLSVMAAIMMADELHEATRQNKILMREISSLKESRNALNERVEQIEAECASTLTLASEEIERIVGKLGRS
jgi:cell division protein ZapA